MGVDTYPNFYKGDEFDLKMLKKNIKILIIAILIVNSLCLPGFATGPNSICFGDNNAPAFTNKGTYGITQDVSNTYPYAVTVNSRLSTIGYNSTVIQNCTAAYECSSIGSNAVFYNNSHGNAGFFTHPWKDSNGIWQLGVIGATAGDASLLGTYSSTGLSSVRLAYFSSCCSASASGLGNLITQSVSQGADAAIGWRNDLLQAQSAYYDDRFFTYTNNTSVAIYAAAYSAQVDTYSKYGSYGGTDSYQIEGNYQETLKPAAYGVN